MAVQPPSRNEPSAPQYVNTLSEGPTAPEGPQKAPPVEPTDVLEQPAAPLQLDLTGGRTDQTIVQPEPPAEPAAPVEPPAGPEAPPSASPLPDPSSPPDWRRPSAEPAQPAPAPDAPARRPEEPYTPIYGENLWVIADRLIAQGLPGGHWDIIDQIMELNPKIRHPDKIFAGVPILLPNKTTPKATHKAPRPAIDARPRPPAPYRPPAQKEEPIPYTPAEPPPSVGEPIDLLAPLRHPPEQGVPDAPLPPPQVGVPIAPLAPPPMLPVPIAPLGPDAFPPSEFPPDWRHPAVIPVPIPGGRGVPLRPVAPRQGVPIRPVRPGGRVPAPFPVRPTEPPRGVIPGVRVPTVPPPTLPTPIAPPMRVDPRGRDTGVPIPPMRVDPGVRDTGAPAPARIPFPSPSGVPMAVNRLPTLPGVRVRPAMPAAGAGRPTAVTGGRLRPMPR